MPVNWKSAENQQRLLACLFLSLEEKKQTVNHARIAEVFGQGVSANAIEQQFRKVRAAAKELKVELENGDIPAAPASVPKTQAKKTKKDVLSGVQDGRVEKKAPKVKEEKPSRYVNPARLSDEMMDSAQSYI